MRRVIIWINSFSSVRAGCAGGAGTVPHAVGASAHLLDRIEPDRPASLFTPTPRMKDPTWGQGAVGQGAAAHAGCGAAVEHAGWPSGDNGAESLIGTTRSATE